MTGKNGSRTAGFALVGAALLGVVGMAVFSPKGTRAGSVATANGASRPTQAERPLPKDSTLPIVIEERAHVASPFIEPSSDSIIGRCLATARERIEEIGGDTAGAVVLQRFGVRPPPGRGPDSLIVEGTATGTDTTRAVWHCAATSYPSGAVATLVAVVENGWPGAGQSFDTVHAINLAAEDACLQRTKTLYREYVFRGLQHRRVGDTLRVSGEAIPLNVEDLAADFQCTAVVRDHRIVATSAKAGK